MGIRGLMRFLKMYPTPLLSSVDVHKQYVLVDCRALLFMFVHKAKDEGISGNYLDFRQKVLKFFRNLDQCDIKPIMIYDGFARDEDPDANKFLDIGQDRSSIEIRNCSLEINFRRKLFVLIMKQTAAEKNAPWFSARPESYEDLAALSKLLRIPVLSNDTIFAAFNLDVPYLMLDSFLWEKPEKSNGRMVIKADQFSMKKIVQTFKIKEEYFYLFCVLFYGKTFERYEAFRNNNFKKDMMIPNRLNTTNDSGFSRPSLMENAFIWFSRRQNPVENIVDDIVTTISDAETGKRSQKEIFQKQKSYKNPKVRRLLLLGMVAKISDPEIRKLLESGLEQAISDESDEYLDDASLRRMYEGNFPIWAPRLLYCQASNQPFHSHRVVFSNISLKLDPRHPFLQEIPKIIYQLLMHKGKGELIVDLVDEYVEFSHTKNSSTCINLPQDTDVSKPLVDLTQPDTDEKQRRTFLLNLLLPDAINLSKYKMHAYNLCDEMKLTLAITNFWAQKHKPDRTLVQAMVTMLSVMQIRNQLQECMMQSTMFDVFGEEETEKEDFEVDKDNKNVEIRISATLWEESFESVITLNQILNFPLPEPSLGKFYNFRTLLKLHESVISGEDIQNKIKAKGFPELYHKMIEIVS